MIAYVDSSVVLRLTLGQAGRLREWRRIESGVASGLVEVECLRTLDRLRIDESLTDESIARYREAVYALMLKCEVVWPDATVLRRASQPLPTPVGTLDAIHLATALTWREQRDDGLAFATHDRALGVAARSMGFKVIGL